jgi:hypothetical protein
MTADTCNSNLFTLQIVVFQVMDVTNVLEEFIISIISVVLEEFIISIIRIEVKLKATAYYAMLVTTYKIM